MVLLDVFTILSVFVCTVRSDSCPAKYRKLSPNHTFCLPSIPGARCYRAPPHIVGMSEIDEILDAHNTYRSKVAMGKEENSLGELPTAANMTELTWDQELADIAQKWANYCEIRNDCEECRSTPTEKYVGQNIARTADSCPKGTCEEMKPNWKRAVYFWYDEVKQFDRKLIAHYSFDPNVEHFTQVIWSDTLTVGCGYVSYSRNGRVTRYYVCNYGPGGGWPSQSVYKIGEPCSQCPANTCCGDTCETGKVYPGLCRATN